MPDTNTSRDIVVNFYEAALNEKNPDKAREFLGNTYIQHNPNVPDGIEGFLRFIAFRREKYPNARNEIKRVIAEGDLVVLHVHSKREPTDRGRAIVDIFKVENGKIVEHWDVIQDVPEKSANDNTMF